MFSGIVEDSGTVVAVEPEGDGVRVVIEAPFGNELVVGQSVSVDGACLTVERVEGDRFQVTAVPETMSKTVLGRRPAGSRVNLERSLRMGDRLDGHLVLGHVDGVVKVTKTVPSTPGTVVSFALETELRRYVARKGSVTINGVSLTVAQIEPGGFNVALVPHTLQVTTLGDLHVGDRANLEVDVVARYVERLVSEERVLGGTQS